MSERKLDEDEMIQRYPKVINLLDTIVMYDPDTYKESVTIVQSKMIEAYYLLIQEELKKEKPDQARIDKLNEKGRIIDK